VLPVSLLFDRSHSKATAWTGFGHRAGPDGVVMDAHIGKEQGRRRLAAATGALVALSVGGTFGVAAIARAASTGTAATTSTSTSTGSSDSTGTTTTSGDSSSSTSSDSSGTSVGSSSSSSGSTSSGATSGGS
jgi:hypothetical protein